MTLPIQVSCEICGRNRDLDRHHIESRGMGGSKDPAIQADENLITLCRSCHLNIHEGGWELQRSAHALYVIDLRSGKEVMRRVNAPDFDQPAFLHMLNTMDSSLGQAVSVVAYVNDDQLVEVFRISRSLGRRAWVLQAAVLHEAQRRSVYGDGSLKGIARTFEISLNLAEKYTRVWRAFFDSGEETEFFNVEEFIFEEPSWYVIAATESPEPRRWLAYAQDRKAENPRYSIRDFRSDIQQAIGAAAMGLEAEPATVGLDERVAWDCPWVKPFCTRSGRPVPAQDCECNQS